MIDLFKYDIALEVTFSYPAQKQGQTDFSIATEPFFSPWLPFQHFRLSPVLPDTLDVSRQLISRQRCHWIVRGLSWVFWSNYSGLNFLSRLRFAYPYTTCVKCWKGIYQAGGYISSRNRLMGVISLLEFFQASLNFLWQNLQIHLGFGINCEVDALFLTPFPVSLSYGNHSDQEVPVLLNICQPYFLGHFNY